MFYDPEDGFGSLADTYRQAHARDPSITRADVKRYLDEQEVRQRKRGKQFNSYVADGPRFQFQVDLADMTGADSPSLLPFVKHVQALAAELQKRTKSVPARSIDLGAAATFLRKQDGFNQEFSAARGLSMKRLLEAFEGLRVESGRKGGKTTVILEKEKSAVRISSKKGNTAVPRYAVCAVVFSKKTAVLPVSTKRPPEVRDQFLKAIEALGLPKSIYTDEDGAFQNDFAEMLRAHHIQHIITRAQAPFVERFIRTFKRMTFLRQEGASEDQSWVELLPAVLAKYNRTSHHAHGFTPNYAHDDENAFYVKIGLMIQAKKRRAYPPIEVGDRVRLLQKPGKMTQRKEHFKEWGAIKRVESIEVESGVPFYYTLEGEEAGRANKRNGFMRHELLKVQGETASGVGVGPATERSVRRRLRTKTKIERPKAS